MATQIGGFIDDRDDIGDIGDIDGVDDEVDDKWLWVSHLLAAFCSSDWSGEVGREHALLAR